MLQKITRQAANQGQNEMAILSKQAGLRRASYLLLVEGHIHTAFSVPMSIELYRQLGWF